MRALVHHGPGDPSRAHADAEAEAYDVFSRPSRTGALKVAPTRDRA